MTPERVSPANVPGRKGRAPHSAASTLDASSLPKLTPGCGNPACPGNFWDIGNGRWMVKIGEFSWMHIDAPRPIKRRRRGIIRNLWSVAIIAAWLLIVAVALLPGFIAP